MQHKILFTRIGTALFFLLILTALLSLLLPSPNGAAPPFRIFVTFICLVTALFLFFLRRGIHVGPVPKSSPEDSDKVEKLTEQIIRTEKMASIGRLSASIVHEINTPLGIILGYSQLLSEDTPDDSPQKQSLKIIEKQTRNCQHIVADLLKFSRRPASRVEDMDISEAAMEVLAVMEHDLSINAIELKRHFTIGLPKVHINTEQIQQVIINLVNNAAHAMARGGVLHVRSSLDGKGVRLSVEDDGPGVPPDLQEKIFEPFFTTRDKGKGTGLGLSVSREIIEKNGGQLTLESPFKNGRGAAFHIWLPGIPREKKNG
jgi:signal transduction histidine kinase